MAGAPQVHVPRQALVLASLATGLKVPPQQECQREVTLQLATQRLQEMRRNRTGPVSQPFRQGQPEAQPPAQGTALHSFLARVFQDQSDMMGHQAGTNHETMLQLGQMVKES